MARLSNFLYYSVRSPLTRWPIALIFVMIVGECFINTFSAEASVGHSSLVVNSEPSASRGYGAGEVPDESNTPKVNKGPQRSDSKRPSRTKSTSDFVNMSWWWSTYVLAPIAAICLIPFGWYYVLPRLGPVAWKLCLWACTLVGFSAALAVIYIAIISAFDYLGAGVDGTLNSLSESLGELGHQLPTPQGMTALAVVSVCVVVLIWCLPLIYGKIAALSNT